MKKKICKICMIVGVLVLVLCIVSNGVFAAINPNYELGKEVIEKNLDEKVKDSVIFDALASLIYAVASLVEWIVGWLFKFLTGSKVFPWADRIIFNSIPLLDVNFFNPSEGSLFLSAGGNSTALSEIIRSTYFTILALVVAFFSIVVGISAIKLALSSIASEKAKYKEALTRWIFSIVMLFLMHNLMSFIFFVNEKMVEVASGMLNGKITQAQIDLLSESTTIDSKTAIDNFVNANSGIVEDASAIFIKQNSKIAYSLMTNKDYQESALAKAFNDASADFANGWNNVWNGNGSQSISVLTRDIKFINGNNIDEDDTEEEKMKKSITGEVSYLWADERIEISGVTMLDIKEYINKENEVMSSDSIVYKVLQYYLGHMDGIEQTMIIGEKNKERSFKWAKAIYSIWKSTHVGVSTTENPDLMATLAQYFKESAYTVPTDENGNATGWKRAHLTIQGALLYGIFVFQSLIFLFSYLKRFMYIIILAIMAPAIVLLDFLGKSLA